MNSSTRTSPRRILADARDELRQRRQARADYRTLERELASYATQAEVDDLLASLSRYDDPEAEMARDILTRNRHGRSTKLAS
jgi:hypothetical protein